jgi:NAD dependent epimerase/dehydratase family enzyme
MIFGEMAVVLIEGHRAVPQRLQEQKFEFKYPEVDPALRNLLKK